MDLIQGDLDNLSMPLDMVQTGSAGTIQVSPMISPSEINLNAVIGKKSDEVSHDFIEFPFEYEINSNATINGTLKANSIVCFYLFPAVTEDTPAFETIADSRDELSADKILDETSDEFIEKETEKRIMEASRPYILVIKNNSFDFIKDFKINNLRQAMQVGKEYDDRVTVSYGLHGYTYQAFLSHFVTHPTKFGLVRYEAYHGYHNYVTQQLTGCPLYVIEGDPNGDTKRTALVLSTALNQFITNAVQKRCDFDFTDMSWDMRLDLMPEAMVKIYLYPAVIMNLWKQEKEPLARPEIGGLEPLRIRVTKDRENELLKEKIQNLEAQLLEKGQEATSEVSDAAFPKIGK